MTLSEYTQNLTGIVQSFAFLIMAFSILFLCLSLFRGENTYYYLSIYGLITAICGLNVKSFANLPYNLGFVVLALVLVLLPISFKLDQKNDEKRRLRRYLRHHKGEND
ncbi:hypothetical protein ACFRGK_06530 [Bacillus subtilis]|uniref:hypothetical protein n=1 Tax=Bacillus subtilis TaxID=1423 RepID=UPI0033151ACE